MRIRLKYKLADLLNGIDLSKYHAGQTVDLPPVEARLLMAEGWAEFAGPSGQRDRAHERSSKGKPERAQARKKSR